jgi:hypothetical protein
MWIFLTAVFLVLFFLFYRHPQIMLKATGTLIGVLVLLVITAYLYFEWKQAPDTSSQPPSQSSADLQRQIEADRQEAKAAEEREQQAAADQAQRVAAFEARRQAAIPNVTAIATHLDCTIPLFSCVQYRLTVTVSNKSNEIVSGVWLGWVFLPEGQFCPTTLQAKRTEQVLLRPRRYDRS